jgi:hypothetical protein
VFVSIVRGDRQEEAVCASPITHMYSSGYGTGGSVYFLDASKTPPLLKLIETATDDLQLPPEHDQHNNKLQRPPPVHQDYHYNFAFHDGMPHTFGGGPPQQHQTLHCDEELLKLVLAQPGMDAVMEDALQYHQIAESRVNTSIPMRYGSCGVLIMEDDDEEDDISSTHLNPKPPKAPKKFTTKKRKTPDIAEVSENDEEGIEGRKPRKKRLPPLSSTFSSFVEFGGRAGDLSTDNMRARVRSAKEAIKMVGLRSVEETQLYNSQALDMVREQERVEEWLTSEALFQSPHLLQQDGTFIFAFMLSPTSSFSLLTTRTSVFETNGSLGQKQPKNRHVEYNGDTRGQGKLF